MATSVTDKAQADRMRKAAREAQKGKRQVLQANGGGDRYDVISGQAFNVAMNARIAEAHGGKLVAPTLMLYLVLLRSIHVNPKSPLRGWCDLSQRQLQALTYSSRETVRKALDILEGEGLVEVERLSYGKRKRHVYLPKVKATEAEGTLDDAELDEVEWI